MFSPLNIEIVPSRGFHYFGVACSIAAILALLFSEAGGLLLIALLVLWLVLSFSVVFQKLSVTKIVWNLDHSSMKLRCNDRGWLVGERIEKMHLLPGLCFFRVKPLSGKPINVCVFPDSVPDADYRRLKVALQLGKMALTAKAIHN